MISKDIKRVFYTYFLILRVLIDILPIIKTSPIARLCTQVSILDKTCKRTVYLNYKAKCSLSLGIFDNYKLIAKISDYSNIFKKD